MQMPAFSYLKALMLAIFITQSTFHLREVATFCAYQFTATVIQVMLNINGLCYSSVFADGEFEQATQMENSSL